ncbi:MAG: DUF2061 domain-containing protein [Candidatus Woesearchaeota archaeon]|nr:MAG: DUF2061 domain-containing protein [Candidatus Woesearchaeota archaeon]
MGFVKHHEHPKRSIVKSLTWRVSATIATMILVFAFTGSLALSFSIGFIEVFAKMLLYYFHERVWSGIRWGVRVEDVRGTDDE